MPKKEKLHAHFIGIGGIGVSALARGFLAQKWLVSGSDLEESTTTRELEKDGIEVKIGHKKGTISKKVSLVVYSQAVRDDNPELREARRRRIPTLSYPEAVGALTEKYKTIAIAGAHGKSTTTALVSLILRKAGLNPTVIIGTKLKEFGGKNFLRGTGNYLVLEADEWKGAFLHYSPAVALVTNIDREHLDYYKTLGGVKRAFLSFIKRIQPEGTLVLNGDDPILSSLTKQIKAVSFKNNLQLLWYSHEWSEAREVQHVLKIPGVHNVSNALGALTVAKSVGVKKEVALHAIGLYRGAWRRFEFRGMFRIKKQKIPVYDDYAHHPTEIKATLAAFREKFPNAKIVCVFEPHQAKRLKQLFKEFQHAFDGTDMLLILPAYRVAGRDVTLHGYTSEDLVKKMQKRQPKKLNFYIANPANIKKALRTLLGGVPKIKSSAPQAVIVMMGAGNIYRFTDSLLK